MRRIRLANQGDAEAIAATLYDAFAPFEPLYTPAAFRATTPTAEQLRARWSEGPVWIAELEHAVVGTVSAVSRPAELYVRSMAVRPGAQGQGTGAGLLVAAEARATSEGLDRMVLTTTPFLHAAIRLYRRHGFRQTGTSDLFGTPLIVMTKQLH